MRRPWSWIARSVSLAALLAALPLFARAGPNDGRATTFADGLDTDATTLVAGDAELYLAVWLNQADTGRLARFILRNETLAASSETLKSFGLKWPGSDAQTGMVLLRDLPGVEATYDASRQRISLVVPTAMLGGAPVRGGFVQRESPTVDRASQVAGAILNYSAFGQRTTNGAASLGGSADVRVFGVGPGTWSTSVNMRASNGLYAERSATRLDSTWQLDFPERMLSITVGDAISGATSWSRPVRMGGIRVARNFALQPYRITAPLASFAGEVALPSTVDLFVDGLKQASREVPPGQFVFDSVPTLDGAGNARLVITDLNGQRRVVEYAFYGTPRLLEQGLSDWSVELGALRENFGQTSFDYAPRPMASASGRYGWRNSTTLEGHLEGDERVQVAGVGVTQLLGSRGGLLSLAVASSRNQDTTFARHDSGLQRSITYQWSTRGFNLNLHSIRNDDGFRDLASQDGARLPRATDQAYVGLSELGGQWGLGWFREVDRDGTRSGFASLSWSRQSDRFGYFGVQLNKRLDDGSGRDHGVEINGTWTIPLGPVSMSVRTNRTRDGSLNAAAEIAKEVPGEIGGWGWRAEAGNESGVQAQATRSGRYGQWTAGMRVPRGNAGTSVYASVEGGFALLGGHAFAMRRIDQAFALVSTDGIAGVPVRLHNNVVGQTDAHGLLVVGRLNPWLDNKLSIDPLSLPADMWVGLTEMSAVPPGRTGVLVTFKMRPSLSVQLHVQDTTGQPLPAGSPVWLLPLDVAGSPPLTVIGQDSLLYLQDPPKDARLRVRHGGLSCEVALPEITQASGFVELDEITCR